jgi:hypothetical protein
MYGASQDDVGSAFWPSHDTAGGSISTEISSTVYSSLEYGTEYYPLLPLESESQSHTLVDIDRLFEEILNGDSQSPASISDEPKTTSVTATPPSPFSPDSAGSCSVQLVGQPDSQQLPTRTSETQVTDEPPPKGKTLIDSVHSEFACSSCKRYFTSNVRYRQHIRQRFSVQYICEACGKSFTLLKDLNRHKGSSKASLSACHVRPSKGPTSAKGFTCFCKRPFSRHDSLLRHINRKLAKGNLQHYHYRE